MVEQGLSLTVLETPDPLQAPGRDRRREFTSARRIWLGGVSGTDWLHDALERELGPSGCWFSVESERRTDQIGAAGEIALVTLILLGARLVDAFATKFAERTGERAGDVFSDWVRDRGRARREQTYSGDPPPDFYGWDVQPLAKGMRGELAELLEVDEGQLDLVCAERQPGLALRGVYRDVETGQQYVAEVRND